MRFNPYEPGDFYDELFVEKGRPRPEAIPLIERIHSLSPGELQRRQQAAQNALFRLEATFNVYNDDPWALKLPIDYPVSMPSRHSLTCNGMASRQPLTQWLCSSEEVYQAANSATLTFLSELNQRIH